METSFIKYLSDDISVEHGKEITDACRTAVRKIQSYPVLSPEWMSLVEYLRKLTRLVHLETKIPNKGKVVDSIGRDTESGGTLWDQALDETAIRTLVEEAKVNLCLRVMHDFKQWSNDANKKNATIAEARQHPENSEALIAQKMAHFEEALCMLLARALAHRETLQLMDVRLLIEHIVFVLQASSESGTLHVMPKMSETMVLYYFESLMRHAEQLNNGELLAQARELNLLRLLVAHVMQHQTEWDSDAKDAIALGLASLADNEEFGPQWEDFFRTADGTQDDPELKRSFLELKKVVLPPDEFLKEHPEKKKGIYPLLDLFGRVKRQL